jgi:Mn-dependent DtxR family transcriptional regulator
MKISQKKIEKISEQILGFLYSISPKPVFTSNIAVEIARDEEFVKNILNDLKKKGFVIMIKKNPKGVDYKKRARWKLSNKVYDFYKKKQGVNF